MVSDVGPAGERDDQCRREVRSLHKALDTEHRAIEGFRVELDRTGAALERVHRTWDAGVRETLGRLDELVAQVDEAVRLTRVLVDRRRRPTL
jgi:hypothetical protein